MAVDRQPPLSESSARPLPADDPAPPGRSGAARGSGVRLGPQTPPELDLRDLTVADLDAVMDIEPLAYPFPWSRGNVADSLGGAHRARGLFDPQGPLVAYAFAMPGVEEWHLLNLTVLPSLQGQGLARTLLDDLLGQARRDGSARIWLEVRATNARARRLYERYGFDAVGLRRGYYPAGPGRREDAVVMRLDCGSGAGAGVDGAPGPQAPAPAEAAPAGPRP